MKASDDDESEVEVIEKAPNEMEKDAIDAAKKR